MTAHRTERVGDAIRDVLSRVVREEMRDPRLGFVTLTGVSVSADLKHAKVFVAVHGDPAEKAASIEALEHAGPFLRRALARDGRLRHTPELHFSIDEAFEKGFRVEALLREIRGDREDGER